ncbi:hypothetical protein T492DRAFT_857957 [Pavlovales sp. CCMP2436]|nr:hypothetical protein T492DRAFT_857957 [Pavlovales sp. CCMP2436]
MPDHAILQPSGEIWRTEDEGGRLPLFYTIGDKQIEYLPFSEAKAVERTVSVGALRAPTYTEAAEQRKPATLAPRRVRGEISRHCAIAMRPAAVPPPRVSREARSARPAERGRRVNGHMQACALRDGHRGRGVRARRLLRVLARVRRTPAGPAPKARASESGRLLASR